MSTNCLSVLYKHIIQVVNIKVGGTNIPLPRPPPPPPSNQKSGGTWPPSHTHTHTHTRFLRQ